MGRRRLITVAAVASTLLAATASQGQDREPDWLRKPTRENLFAVFPQAALKKGVDGRATIGCVVTVQGTLRECKVLFEDPPALGFGAAALSLSTQFRMKPALKDGQPVEGEVRIPINWHGIRQVATSAKPRAEDKVYARLPWREAPTFADLISAYPAKARAAKSGGAVTLSCKINKLGRLGHCETVSEEPKYMGFGSAAKALAAKFVGPANNGQGESLEHSRALLVVTFPASALDQPAPVIGKPQWVAVPRVNDMEAVMPAAAKKAGVYKARVVMSCKVVTEGAVEDCKTATEEPAGLGYGPAAEALSKYFKLTVWTDEGLPTVGGTIRIPLRFDFEPPVASAAKP